MQQLKRICIPAFMVILSALPAAAQKKIRQNDKPSVKKGLAPVFRSSLGNVLSNALPPSMMKQLLDSALVSRDSTGHRYAVVSFDFGYRTAGTYNNNKTGRPEMSSLYTSFHFNGNKLDSLWRTRIRERIKPGDELFFDHIIAKDETGTRYLSSSLHFKVH